MKLIFALAAMIALISVNVATTLAVDTDTIPPEVLKRMDPDIRSGKRPTFATIKQGDIFGLRQQPKFAADFVRFDFNVNNLSSVQQGIVESWITEGHNAVYLLGKEIKEYAPLLKPAGFAFKASNGLGGRSNPKIGTVACGLLRHKVNTDCEKVTFDRSYSHHGASDRYATYAIPVLSGITEEWSVIAEVDGGDAVAGSFPLGKGRIVFQSAVSGTDARRWQLNFWHWALGLSVPGSVEASTATASSLSSNEAAIYDTVFLKNGDEISGTILNNHFTIQTSYAELKFERSKIEKIVLEGDGAITDSLFLRVGDKMSGLIREQVVQIKLMAGQTAQVDKDKIMLIQMRKTEVK